MSNASITWSSTAVPSTASSDATTTDTEILTSRSRAKRLLQHLKSEISTSYTDLPMIMCCFVSGMCDSASYNAWSCFVSMQTGNTVFLALGASKQPAENGPYGWLKSLISISSFLVGCAVFARTFRSISRGTLAASFFLQFLCIYTAASLVHLSTLSIFVPSQPGKFDIVDVLPLFFLAFQSGGQIVASRMLGLNEIPTTVLTSVYCDLVMDAHIFVRKNVKRNRRAASALTFLAGAICGGFIGKILGLSAVFWIAGGVKFGIAVSWIMWKGKTVELDRALGVEERTRLGTGLGTEFGRGSGEKKMVLDIDVGRSMETIWSEQVERKDFSCV